MNRRALYKNRDWLEEQYIKRGLSANKIAKLCDREGSVIYAWLRKYEIQIRSPSEAANNCYVRWPEVKEVIGNALKKYQTILPEKERRRINKKLSEKSFWRTASLEQVECRKREISKQMSGENSPRGMLGKHHSKEAKKKISVGNKGKIITEQQKENISKKLKNKPKSESHRQKIGNSLRGRKRPDMSERMKRNNPSKRPEVAIKMGRTLSKTRSRLIVEGKINSFSHGKFGFFYSEKNKKELWYRSSYELQAYKILEQLSKVVKYESEPFYIPYNFQGRERNYIPDILITYDDDSQELIEVMRENLLEDEMRIAKLKVAKRYCDKNNMKFSVWTERRLFDG